MAQDRILIVDDEAAIIKMTTDILIRSGDGYDVEGVSDPEAALGTVREWKPNLVLLDLQLGHRLDGRDVCRAIRSDSGTAHTAVVVLTSMEEEEVEAALFDVGADDYIRKQQFSPKVLVSRVRAVLRRTRPLKTDVLAREDTPDSVLKRGPLLLDPGRREARVDGRVVPLTPTEFHMLYKLALDSTRALRRSELLDRGGGTPSVDRTVDVHMLSIRRKLGTFAWLVETVFRHGYRLAMEPPLKQPPLGQA